MISIMEACRVDTRITQRTNQVYYSWRVDAPRTLFGIWKKGDLVVERNVVKGLFSIERFKLIHGMTLPLR